MHCIPRYERYSQKKGWKFEVVDIAESDLKGFKVLCPLRSSTSIVSSPFQHFRFLSDSQSNSFIDCM